MYTQHSSLTDHRLTHTSMDPAASVASRDEQHGVRAQRGGELRVHALDQLRVAVAEHPHEQLRSHKGASIGTPPGVRDGERVG